ncbi:aldose 1-epimerase [Algibacter sp. AS12]|uniref:aldose 1-epimerase n=1 Tax=Algibacter sp. AS12 TaxID=3135773 RepID=UPI00398B356E
MFSIIKNKTSNTIEIKSLNHNVSGLINLNEGASLQVLTLNGQAIIKSLEPLPYKDTYASSILFPFANRIKDGQYTYNDKSYQFEINQKEENNALHGLVYNKTFNVVESYTNIDSASLTLEYIEENESIGFPYTFKIQLKYTFTETNLELDFSVENTDSKIFPFNLGWHPYFVSDNLSESILEFDSSEKLVIGDRNITTGTEKLENFKSLKIENKKLDDCWILDSNIIQFYTPKYKLSIHSSAKNNFLQAYTPPKLNTIAIEPTTGVSNSFNNNIGLDILKPNDTYSITWTLNLENN